MKAQGASVDIFDKTIRNKAFHLADQLGIPKEFCASSGFADKFKNRRQLVLRMKAGEGEAASRSTDIRDWQDNVLPDLIRGYLPQKTFNTD